jgi:hypothetical protein
VEARRPPPTCVRFLCFAPDVSRVILYFPVLDGNIYVPLHSLNDSRIQHLGVEKKLCGLT